ncbi:hypothetical protein RB614_20480 [Phytohabitans sp. ZYX-F-186]|uniref:Uncharacterized protein n=1 Tax=Phytohabitans maris TaxID=3071409 RepID=A0ABU0ZIV7_9ACTN|nr:hypothetical protein [Phytohabitans sp. ZYX-F-186]MDQ7906893.1 hypothetical protein [Phytohabitans sp. ZYX-F-186]
MTGDVFEDVDIPGVEATDGDEARLAMVVSHPCSMRDGYKLREALQALRVIKYAAIELSGWKGHYDVMPLPNLYERGSDDEMVNPEDSYAAVFELRGRVETSAMHLDKRIACLSEEGVAYLHQRMNFSDTRFPPRTGDLVAACAGPFSEAELAEQWNQTYDLSDLDEPKRDEVLATAAKEFDELLSQQREGQAEGRKKNMYRLRDDLSSQRKAPGARREILRIIKQRIRGS